MSKYEKYKKLVFETIIDLVDKGYVQGTGGNVSARVKDEDVLAVTPSQLDYSEMVVDDICVVDFDLDPIEGKGLKPSMETAMHVSCYKNRHDVNAVVHTHQIYASIFSIINTPVPALFDEVASDIGNLIEIVPYGLSGSSELHENITAKLSSGANCYIMQNHGVLSLGIDMKKAKGNAILLEKNARVYYYALTTGKEITTLPKDVQDLLGQLLKARQDDEIN